MCNNINSESVIVHVYASKNYITNHQEPLHFDIRIQSLFYIYVCCPVIVLFDFEDIAAAYFYTLLSSGKILILNFREQVLRRVYCLDAMNDPKTLNQKHIKIQAEQNCKDHHYIISVCNMHRDSCYC